VDEARGVRQICAWVGGERLTIGEIWRRLTHAGDVTRTGKTVWDRSVGGGILKQPASMGAAAFGKTRQGPRRPRRRAQRGRPVHPRRAVSVSAGPAEAWMTIAVPAMVEPAGCAAVHEPLQSNQHHARPSRRGARYRWQGLGQCQQCGDAFDGTPVSRQAAKGPLRT
jgi:site-specific DNA recombinase